MVILFCCIVSSELSSTQSKHTAFTYCQENYCIWAMIKTDYFYKRRRGKYHTSVMETEIGRNG